MSTKLRRKLNKQRNEHEKSLKILAPNKFTLEMPQGQSIKLKNLDKAALTVGEKPPSPLLKRLIALKNLQYEHFMKRAQFYNELFRIELNHQRKVQVLCGKRARIINGIYHVRGTQKPPAVSRYEMRLSNNQTYPTIRLPHFWLVVLLNTPIIKHMIERNDLKCLESLNDLRLRHYDDRSFAIEFHFDQNDYFSNAVLKKRYYQIATIDADDPFGYEGPEIYRTEGCAIYWKKGKNLTYDYARNGGVSLSSIHNESTTSLLLPNQNRRHVDSFFHFFNPPQFPTQKVVVDMELERVLTIDFEIGNLLRKRVIPFSSLIYIHLINKRSELKKPLKAVEIPKNAAIAMV